ncbi:hypothetical protein PENTCL1PPCAC_18688, partial [Pristionchus entomophagus]
EMRQRFVELPVLIVLIETIFLPLPVSPIQCYNSDTPHLDYDDVRECAEGEVCYVEFFINNHTGSVIHRYDRFCTQKAQCTRLLIHMNEDVDISNFTPDTQAAFYSLFANSTREEGEEFITRTWFRCCNTNQCNNIDLYAVKARFGVWPPLNSVSTSVQHIVLAIICVVLYNL